MTSLSPSGKLDRIRLDLLRAAQSGETVTYGNLMKRHRLSRGRRLSQTIREVDGAELKKGAPGFAAIIVRKDTGFPGGGYFCDDDLPDELRRPKSRSADPRLSSMEIGHIRDQQRLIWSFYGKNSTRAI